MEHRRSSRNTLASSSPDDPSFRSSSHVFSGEEIDYRELFIQISRLIDCLQASKSNAVACICQEVVRSTHGKARIVLRPARPEPGAFLHRRIEFNGHFYGDLIVSTDPPTLDQAATVALAIACSYILYILEVTAYIESHYSPASYNPNRTLKKREREILALMCRGYTSEAIAEELHLSPHTVNKYREGIYNTLGVHSEEEATLAAFVLGLYAPVEGLTPQSTLLPEG